MTERQKIDIKLIRLSTGEDIIANCLMDDDTESVVLDNPMQVFVKRVSTVQRTMLVMMPWLPLELIEDNVACVNYQDIITVLQPKKSFVEYYHNIVDQYNTMLDSKESLNFNDNMDDEEEESSDENIDDDEEDEAIQEILNIHKERKKNSLH